MSEAASRSHVGSLVTPGRAVVLGLFLFSGASGLIYEVVWSRMFALVLGTTVYAVATVLGVFMGGLALGSWLFGRVADRPGANGLRLYAYLELAIGAFAIVLPLLMWSSDALYRAVWPAVADSFGGQMVVRVVMAAAILVVPSTLMGGTLPVLSRYLVRSRARTGREIGTLYAINTLGAVIGCFTAGFFLLELLGMRLSLLLAAVLNFAVGFLALAWARRTDAPEPELADVADEPAAGSRVYGPYQVRLALLLYAGSGFAALALEVLWTRSLLYFTSVDTWAFTAMLSAFLCGIGLGSLVMARFTPRIARPLLWLGVIEVLIGVTAAASIPLFARLHDAQMWVIDLLGEEATLTAKIVLKLFCSFFIMLVPTLLMGAAFPLVSAIYVGARRGIGRGIGTLYALNTVGAIAGSLAAGFLLIPVLGLERGILLCAFLYVVIGMLLCTAVPARGAVRLAGGLAVIVVGAGVVTAVAAGRLPLDRLGVTGGPMVLQSAFFKRAEQAHTLLYAHEGPAASLVVLENPLGTKLLNINGITTAINNHLDMIVHRMLSHLPILLHPEPETVLVVGFGMGSTPWGCCQHESVERVDVVELLRAEKRTAAFFEDINHGVLDHPKLRFIEGDGRNYLLATDASYDVISFNAIHPRFSANLYTKDFYELCRRRLSDDGVICAWMTQDSMSDREFRMLCRSFVDVFPHSTLWYCNPGHFCLIATMQPTRVDLDDWRRRMAVPAIHDDLADSIIADPFVLLTRFMFGGPALGDYVAGAPLNTDDRPRIEFARETRADERRIMDDLIDRSTGPAPLLEGASERDVEEIGRYARSAKGLMKGQTEFWYAADERPLAAEIEYRRALLECPQNQDVRHNLLFSQVLKDDALRLLAENPAHAGARARLGRILMEEGRLEEAERQLIDALAAEPRLIAAAVNLGYVSLLRGDEARAAVWFEDVIRAVGGDDPTVRYGLATAWDRAGRWAEAQELRDAVLAQDPDVATWFDLLEQTVEAVRAVEEPGIGAAGSG